MNILTDKKIAQIKKIAGLKTQLIAGYLFGSYQTGKQCLTSDIDLGFLCFDKAGLDIPLFSLSVSKILLPKETDIVVCDLNEKPLILIEIINGKVLFQKNIK